MQPLTYTHLNQHPLNPNWFERHPKLTVSGICFFIGAGYTALVITLMNQ